MLDTSKVMSFLPSAKAMAKHSKDKRTKVGAIIIDEEYGIVCSGWNGFPRKVNDHIPERHEAPLKYKWTVHAEINALMNAARKGVSTKGCEMLICDNVLCAGCCAAAIQAGITTIYTPDFDVTNEAHARLQEDYEISMQMMYEAGVDHVTYRGSILAIRMGYPRD